MMARSQTLLAAALLATLAIGRAHANPWYPEDCRTIDYCGAVEDVAWIAAVKGGEPQLLVTSKKGAAVVHNPFPVRESGDGRLHVCMRYDPFGDLEVTCLLVPAREF